MTTRIAKRASSGRLCDDDIFRLFSLFPGWSWIVGKVFCFSIIVLVEKKICVEIVHARDLSHDKRSFYSR
jgi:hypothetical protein